MPVTAQSNSHMFLRAGPPFARLACRSRERGPICGGSAVAPERLTAMAAYFGGRALVLSQVENESAPVRHVVAEWDSCELDEQPLRDMDAWAAALWQARLPDIHGAFAVAWWRDSETLCLARDAVGEKHLYYARCREGLLFATSLHALIASGGVEVQWNESAVAAYLACAYVPGRATMLRNVYEVLPGECVELRRGHLMRGQYWSLPGDCDTNSDRQTDTMAAELRQELEHAVKRRLPASGPIAASLSGGIDSSLVVALIARLYDAPCTTYSISFGSGYRDELEYSAMVARHCGLAHQVIEISPGAVAGYLDETHALLSEPIGDPLTVPNALLFFEASKQSGVVFNGEGGDPCFGGPKNLPMLAAEWMGTGGNRIGCDPYARERNYLLSYHKCFADFDEMLTEHMKIALRENPLEEQFARWFADERWQSFVNKLMAINISLKGVHNILAKVDQLSAPFGVVPRSPLFDRRVVELSMRIRAADKLRGTCDKFILKKAVADLLPDAIVNRPKSGMMVPVEEWCCGPLRKDARERLLDGLAGYDWIRRDYMERLVRYRLSGVRPRHGVKLWLLLALESWLRGIKSVQIGAQTSTEHE